MTKLFQVILSLITLFAVLPAPVAAVYFTSGDSISLDKTKTYNETVFVSGKDIIIDSVINGDLFCAGEKIILNGTVNGDIICAGRDITVNGLVNGSLRLAGQNLDVNSTVNRNITAAGQTLNLSKTSAVKQDAFLAGQSINVDAPVSRDLGVAGRSFNLNAPVSRHLLIGVNSLNMGELAKINGNFDYYYQSSQNAPEFDRTKIEGAVSTYPITSPSTPDSWQISRSFNDLSRLNRIAGIFSALLLGLFLLIIARPQLLLAVKQTIRAPLSVFLIGVAALIITPVLILVFAVSILGIPVALFLFLIYLLGLMLSMTYSAAILGNFLINRFSRYRDTTLFLSLVSGVVILGLFSLLPKLGSLVVLLSVCFGLGAFTSSFLPGKPKN